MFDVETAIGDWKRELCARESVRAEHADELEDHLRQVITALSEREHSPTAALTTEEVFLIASRRVGGPRELAGEFAKADPNAIWRRRWIWMLGGYVGIHIALLTVTFLARTASSLAQPLPMWLGNTAYFAVALLGLGGVLAVARRLSRSGAPLRLGTRARRTWTTRSAIVALAALVVAVRLMLVPIMGTLRSTVFGMFEMAEPELTDYLQHGLSSAPVVALAFLAWFECAREQRNDATSPSAPTR